jgi:hypothetical protein
MPANRGASRSRRAAAGVRSAWWWCGTCRSSETTIGVFRDTHATPRDPHATLRPPHWPHAPHPASPDALQGAWPLDEAAGVRGLCGADEGQDAAGEPWLRHHGVAVCRPCQPRVPDASQRAGLRADAVGDLEGERVPDRSAEPGTARTPREPRRPRGPAATRELHVARAPSPARGRLRCRQATGGRRRLRARPLLGLAGPPSQPPHPRALGGPAPLAHPTASCLSSMSTNSQSSPEVWRMCRPVVTKPQRS